MEVVCIASDEQLMDGIGVNWPWGPHQGGIYHVSETFETEGDGIGCLLEEDPIPDDGETYWLMAHFRPLRDNERQARESWAEMLNKPYLADEVRAALNAGECGDWIGRK